jgi:hypothetical protein
VLPLAHGAQGQHRHDRDAASGADCADEPARRRAEAAFAAALQVDHRVADHPAEQAGEDDGHDGERSRTARRRR